MGVEVYCWFLVDFLQVALTWKTGVYQLPPLVITRLTAPLVNKPLMSHCHNVLVRKFFCMYPLILLAQGYVIMTQIGKVAVSLQHER